MIQELKLPELGENIESAGVVNVLVSRGDAVRKDQPVVEVETEKASLEIPSEFAGKVSKVHVGVGDNVRVGQALVSVETENDGEAPRPEAVVEEESKDEPRAREPEPAAEPPGEAAETPAAEPPKIGEPAAAAPSVRRLARELGIHVDAVSGSGVGGRVTAEDVKRHARELISGSGSPSPGARGVAAEPALPDFSGWGEVERRPMSALRRATTEAMTRAWSTIPHVTQHDSADVTELEAQRRRLAGRVESAGGKLTVTAIAIKVAASALRAFPTFNASVDAERREVVFKRYVHVGVAVDTERGLLVPVIRNADRKNVRDIAVELADLAERARSKRITPDEMHGATFTVSNLGGLGTTYFSPIVNWPEVAILGVGRAETQARIVDDGIEARRILPLSVSYDHRIIDGADAARFLRWIAEALEQPLLLALEG